VSSETPEYFTIRGADGCDYPADLLTLRAWVSAGRVTAEQQVYSSRTKEWSYAADLPVLRDLFGRPIASKSSGETGCLGAGCVVLLVLLVLLIVAAFVAQFGSSKRDRSENTDSASTTASDRSVAPVEPRSDQTPAQRRLAAAAELQRTFDVSVVKGWELKFAVRGRRCDLLHVEGYVNLDPEMMDALAYGTVIYGRILPGGVNRYAFDSGFRDVVYTNEGNAAFKSFGESHLSRHQAQSSPLCTAEIAAGLNSTPERPVIRPEQPKFEQLSWSNARIGAMLYDGSYRHEATITSLDPANDLMEVKYVRSGSIEPKRLSAVAQFWYVRQR
jgi:hypothetical protein